MQLPCPIFYENISELSNEEYALVRRGGLGASDASVMLGLMSKFNKDIHGLIQEKQRLFISDEEKEIGQKVNVRKGKDLEPLILQKFEALTGIPAWKPPHMYYVKDYPYLTVNYDGVAQVDGEFIPVEAKFVSTYGGKYYNQTKALYREIEPTRPLLPVGMPYADSIKVHCEEMSVQYGIPDYYYSQIQQQMLGLDARRGFLTALFEKSWELCVFEIWRDEKVIDAIKVAGYQVAQQLGWKTDAESN